MLVHLVDKFVVFDAVGVDHGCTIVKVEQSFEIYAKVILVLDKCSCERPSVLPCEAEKTDSYVSLDF